MKFGIGEIGGNVYGGALPFPGGYAMVGLYSFQVIKDFKYEKIIFTPVLDVWYKNDIIPTMKWEATISFLAGGYASRYGEREVADGIKILTDSVNVLNRKVNHLQQGDLNLDGVVSMPDFIIFAQNFGKPIN